MVDVAKVTMFGENVGTFRWDNTYAVARFEYDAQFVGKGVEPSPLMMPVQQGRIYSFGNLNREVFNGLPGMLADSLPDTYGRALFEQWLTLTGRTSGNPVETLCYLGIPNQFIIVQTGIIISSTGLVGDISRQCHLPW